MRSGGRPRSRRWSASSLKRRIHRLFVVDEDNSLVGVITTLDILSRLGP